MAAIEGRATDAHAELAVADAERALVALRAELELERASLDRRERAVAESEVGRPVRERELIGQRGAEAEPVRPAPPATSATARWDLAALERLVDGHADAYPDRIDEWRAYLVSLRTVAETDGTLPPNVEGLVQDVFEPLLER